jgi:Spy/CpxP family protein refolding chaperone
LALTTDGMSSAWAEPDGNSRPAGPEWKEGQTPPDKGPRQGKKEHEEQGFAQIVKALGLSDAQKTKIKRILQAERDISAPLRQKLEVNLRLLRQLEQSAEFDEAAVRIIVTCQAQLIAEIMVARIQARNYIRSLLTLEQHAIAEKLSPPHQILDQDSPNHTWTNVVRDIFAHLFRKVDIERCSSAAANDRPPSNLLETE